MTCAACLTPTSGPVDGRGRCTYCATFDLSPLLPPQPPPVEPVAPRAVAPPFDPAAYRPLLRAAPVDVEDTFAGLLAWVALLGLAALGASVCGAVLGGGS